MPGKLIFAVDKENEVIYIPDIWKKQVVSDKSTVSAATERFRLFGFWPEKKAYHQIRETDGMQRD